MKSRTITITALFLSAALHAAVIGGMAWHGFFGRTGGAPSIRASAIKNTDKYALLPDVEIISDRSAIKKEDRAKPSEEKKEDFGSAPKPSASGDSEKESVFEYKDAVKRRIQEARGYPEEARREGTQGVVAVEFSVMPDGSVPYAGVASSSGFAMLDEEAINTIKRASPFPPFPGGVSLEKMNLQVSIIYRLN
jgi:TonB family protein